MNDHHSVILINMPWSRVDRPSIQLGILESVLIRAGIPVEARSFNLAFLDHIVAATGDLPVQDRLHFTDYLDVSEDVHRVGLGDWIFAVSPFSNSNERDEQYLRYLRGIVKHKEIVVKARQMRGLVQPFLETCVRDILASAPRIVGFTSTFNQNVPSLVLAKLLKSHDPSIHIVFGGSNCDGPMGEALHRAFPWVDTVVRGEAERVLPELAKDLFTGKIRPQPGLCYRDDGRRVVVNQESGNVIPMDEVPPPNYDEFFERLSQSRSRAVILPELVIPFETARGCWWGARKHCTFCGLNGSSMTFRSKSPDLAVEELLGLARKYGRLDFIAVDNIIDMRYFTDFLPKLREAGCDLTLFYETKANLKKEHLLAMREAGVVTIQPGIESFSTPILKLMDKGVTALQNIRLLKWCAELGIHAKWALIYGFPREPIEEYERMAELVKSLTHLEPPEYFTQIALERFSPYFERPNESGLKIVGPRAYYRLVFPCEKSTLNDLAYNFDYVHADGRNPNSYVAGLGERIGSWQKQLRARPLLEYRRGPGFLVIRDRRPGRTRSDYSLAEKEAKVYLACDGGATPMAVWKTLQTGGETEIGLEDVEDFLNEMTTARLMYREDNLYLSLAVAMNPQMNSSTADSRITSATVGSNSLGTSQVHKH